MKKSEIKLGMRIIAKYPGVPQEATGTIIEVNPNNGYDCLIQFDKESIYYWLMKQGGVTTNSTFYHGFDKTDQAECLKYIFPLDKQEQKPLSIKQFKQGVKND